MQRRNILFCAGFAVLFVAAIAAVVLSVTTANGWKTAPPPAAPFWETGVVYQVYPRSFCDFDGDGTGDLRGIASKAEYLADLGVRVVWLSPVLQSPMKDFGYDISNYTAIDPVFGTMDDFEDLVRELHRRNLRIVMDFVPNHTSDQHQWFLRSETREEGYADYYVWADSKGVDAKGNQIPPNNWVSEFRESAWEWSDKRQQFYYHQFLKEQPDLNYRSERVRQEMEVVLRFWLDKGVDGFRVDAFKFLFEVEDVSLDEPVAEDSGTTDHDDPAYLNHTYTTNQPETFEVLGEWRRLLDEYLDRVMMVEVYDEVDNVMRYYGNSTTPLADFPFNFLLLDNLRNRTELSGYSLKDTIDLWLDNMPEGKWPNWVLGNHDNERVATRLGDDLVDALNMVMLLLPGTPITYYGEEIGMENTLISWEDTQDPEGCHWGSDHYLEHTRDPERTPMQWSDAPLAGFTTGNDSWLPVNPNYKSVNVAAQENATQSHLKFYRRLTELRREETFRKGDLAYPNYSQDTFSFIRFLEGHPAYLVVVNTAQEDRDVNLHQGANFVLPSEAKVLLRSSTDNTNATTPGSEVSLESLPLRGGEGVLLRLPGMEEH